METGPGGARHLAYPSDRADLPVLRPESAALVASRATDATAFSRCVTLRLERGDLFLRERDLGPFGALILSLPEHRLRVLRLLPLTSVTAASFDGPDFRFIYAPCRLRSSINSPLRNPQAVPQVLTSGRPQRPS